MGTPRKYMSCDLCDQSEVGEGIERFCLELKRLLHREIKVPFKYGISRLCPRHKMGELLK